jgi:hypothetical protein
MTKIVGVHGIGHQFKGAHLLRDEWLPALKDGLARGSRQLDSDEDFTCAFYGDLFRPLGKSGSIPPYEANDVCEEWEQDFLRALWCEAAQLDDAVQAPDANTKASIPHSVQRALNALSHSKFFAGLAERALIYDLKQVRRYLKEPSLRQAARDRVGAAITPDTRVLIAHSLGSVVAYETLCALPAPRVDVFVTLGSPLGIRNLIFDTLDPRPTGGRGVWPPGLKHWINIADRGDVVALVKDLGTHFGQDMTNHVVDNGAKAHDATRYLTTRELGHAVALGI